MSALLNRLHPSEWERLAETYIQAAADARRPAMLPQLMQQRLTPAQLDLVLPYFMRAPQWPSNHVASGAGPYLNLTPYEIYLSFRTAPIGSLGVTGALYETTMLMSKELTLAFGVGYTAGTLIAPLIRDYAPSLWDAIGGTLYNIVESISSAAGSLMSLGAAQGSAVQWFALPDGGHLMQSTGGDYGVVEAWYGYSGGASGCSFCHG